MIGRPVALVKPTPGAGRRSEDEMMAMFNFFNGQGYEADIAALRKTPPALADAGTIPAQARLGKCTNPPARMAAERAARD